MVGCFAIGGHDESEMLRLAGCVEQASPHPLAAAIIGCAAARGLPLTAPVTDSMSLQGMVPPPLPHFLPRHMHLILNHVARLSNEAAVVVCHLISFPVMVVLVD